MTHTETEALALLRAIGKALPVLVLLRLFPRPLSSAQIATYLGIDEKTARAHLRGLLCLQSPPLLAALGNGKFVALPGAQLLLPAAVVDKPVDNFANQTGNFPVLPAHPPTETGEIPARAGKFPALKLSKLREKERKKDDDSLSFSLSSSRAAGNFPEPEAEEDDEFLPACEPLLVRGVYISVAERLVKNHTPQQIDNACEYYDQLSSQGKARGPGFLVLLLKNNWHVPSAAEGRAYAAPNADGNNAYVTGPYAAYVES